MKFIVHTTCSKENGEDYVQLNVPFLSKYDPANNNKPFLGEGFYFWEYNIDYAKIWGKNHYQREYYVCEATIEVDHEKDGYYLDLAGNREHLVGFVELLKEFNLIHLDGTKDIDLCSIINYLRNKCPEEAFPYKVLRAVDYLNDEKAGIQIKFTNKESQKSFTILNPRVILAFKNKQDIVYLTKPFITFVS